MRLVGRSLATAGMTMLLGIALAAPVVAGPEVTTRWVDDDGTAGPNGCGGGASAHPSIQAAIDASDRNDVVIVCPGVYEEHLVITGARRGLTVRGASKWTARIKAPGTGGSDWLVRVDGVRDVTIQWLDLRFPTRGDCVHYEDAVKLVGARSARVRGNRIRPNGPDTFGDCGYGDGLDIIDSRGVLISSNTIRDFQSDGMTVDDSSGRIHGNSVRFLHDRYGKDVEGDEGIEIDDSSFVISANVVRTRGFGAGLPILWTGIDVADDDPTTVRGNRVSGTDVGIDVSASASRVLRNTVTGNWLGIRVSEGDNRIRANNVVGNQDFDCVDGTTGGGTAGTANLWVDNLGTTSDPTGICDAP